MSYINITSDASFDRKTYKAGFGFMITSENFKLYKHGLLKGNPCTSLEAEIMAIENAMINLLAQPEYKGNEFVLIHTDCVGAIKKITDPKCDLTRRVNKLWRKLGTKKGNASFKHIKGHSGEDDSKSRIQQWCDTKAREALQNSLK